MVTQLQTTKTLYETDYNQWVEETVKQLQERNFAVIDLENLIEEVASLGRSEKRELESFLVRLFEHLLKLTYWESERAYNQKHWKGEIRIFRQNLHDLLEYSPSLKSYLLSVFEKSYQRGRKTASDKTGLPLNTFPVNPIGTPEQVLDENWYPEDS
jgi:hypothetical protein